MWCSTRLCLSPVSPVMFSLICGLEFMEEVMESGGIWCLNVSLECCICLFVTYIGCIAWVALWHGMSEKPKSLVCGRVVLHKIRFLPQGVLRSPVWCERLIPTDCQVGRVAKALLVIFIFIIVIIVLFFFTITAICNISLFYITILMIRVLRDAGECLAFRFG